MTADHEGPKDRPLLAAVMTDIHFWVPFIVLLFGIAVLAICAKAESKDRTYHGEALMGLVRDLTA